MEWAPETYLSGRAGFQLDVFVFEYVLDGLVDGVRPEQVPSFSRRAEAAKVLMIKMLMENPDEHMLVCFGDHWDLARQAGQVVNDKPIKMWRVAIGNSVGFGKTYEEAVAKCAVVARMRERRRA